MTVCSSGLSPPAISKAEIYFPSNWRKEGQSILHSQIFAYINDNAPFVEASPILMQQNDSGQLFHPQLLNIASAVQWYHNTDVALTPGWMRVVCVISGGSVHL